MDYYSYIEQGTPKLADNFLSRLVKKPIKELEKLPKQSVDAIFRDINQAAKWTWENTTLVGNKKVSNNLFDVIDATLETVTGPQFVASELPPPPPQQNNTILYAGIGIAALGLVYYLQTKK